MNRSGLARIIFITGTDTGVGKTLLTALLLQHLRQTGCHALAIKPFCSGDRADARLLFDLQSGELTLDEINPFYFPEPLAPLLAARKHQLRIRLDDVLETIRRVASRHLAPCRPPLQIKNQIPKTPKPILLIEGIGGLLVPLGEGFTVADLIGRLNCEIIVVSLNRLGAINHTLLTVRAIQQIANQGLRITMMESPRGHASATSNPRILAELLTPTPVFQVPFLGPNPLQIQTLKRKSKKLKKTLAQILS